MNTVFWTDNFAEACLVRAVLRERGIAAEVSQELRSSGGLLPLDLTACHAVWIAEDARTEEARALAEAVRREDRSRAPDPP